MRLIYIPANRRVHPTTTTKVIALVKTLVNFYEIKDFDNLQSAFKEDLKKISSGNHMNPNSTYKLIPVKDAKENVISMKLMYTPAQSETVLGFIEKEN